MSDANHSKCPDNAGDSHYPEAIFTQEFDGSNIIVDIRCTRCGMVGSGAVALTDIQWEHWRIDR